MYLAHHELENVIIVIIIIIIIIIIVVIIVVVAVVIIIIIIYMSVVRGFHSSYNTALCYPRALLCSPWA